LGLTEEELTHMPKGHPHKKALANLAHTQTLVSHAWLSRRLHMGHPQNLSLYIKQARAMIDSLVLTYEPYFNVRSDLDTRSTDRLLEKAGVPPLENSPQWIHGLVKWGMENNWMDLS
jgi:hypothetical protein